MRNQNLSIEQFKIISEIMDFNGIVQVQNRQVVDCNDFVIDLLRISRDNIIGADLNDFVLDKYRVSYQNMIISNDKDPIEIYLKSSSGNIPVRIWFRLVNLTETDTYIFFLEDLTKQYELHQKWDETQNRFNSIMSRSQIDYMTISTDGTILEIYTNKEQPSIFHRNKTIFEVAQEKYHNKIFRTLTQIWNQPMETSLEFLDIENQYHFITLVPMLNEGTISQIMVSVINFTELVKSEIQIATSEMRIRNLFDLAPFSILVVQSNQIKFINKKMLTQFGYDDEEEVYNLDIKDLLANEEVDRVIKMETDRIQGNRAIPNTYETVAKSKNGSYFPIRILSTSITFFEKRGVMIFIEDLSDIKLVEDEKKHLKIQLARAQKLESLGILAGGIAHDFNNLLHALLGNLTLASMEIQSDTKALKYLNEIEKITRTAGELAQQMLAYSGRGKFYIEVFNLNEFLLDMQELLQISINKELNLELIRSEDNLLIEADKTQIQQVILNLVNNASDASNGNKSIWVSTGREKLTLNSLKSNFYGVKPDETTILTNYVVLKVTDEGHGIDRKELDLIFDPFFTTKFTGRGLGLAVVLGVVRAHKGLIKVDSELNKGTTFTIYIPTTEKEIEENTMSTNNTNSKTGIILLCDDDDAVRKVTKLMLQRIGFEVIDANSGEAALELYKDNMNVDYVLADLTMPGMDGVELTEKLQEINSDVKVVLSSGYSQAELSSKYSAQGFMGFLQKPYSIKHLQEIFTSK